MTARNQAIGLVAFSAFDVATLSMKGKPSLLSHIRQGRFVGLQGSASGIAEAIDPTLHRPLWRISADHHDRFCLVDSRKLEKPIDFMALESFFCRIFCARVPAHQISNQSPKISFV
jgi:hypothetical protein